MLNLFPVFESNKSISPVSRHVQFLLYDHHDQISSQTQAVFQGDPHENWNLRNALTINIVVFWLLDEDVIDPQKKYYFFSKKIIKNYQNILHDDKRFPNSNRLHVLESDIPMLKSVTNKRHNIVDNIKEKGLKQQNPTGNLAKSSSRSKGIYAPDSRVSGPRSPSEINTY